MKNREERMIKKEYCILLVAIIIVSFYRLYLMTAYAFCYTDDDQALMWVGTCMASNFDLWEPHFLGQSYGSMFESIVAVPFYWMGLQLNVCLPLATFIIWFFPFVLLAATITNKTRSKWLGLLPLLLSLGMNYDYDILTNVSRSFISGFFFAFIGIICLEGGKKYRYFVAIILFALAYIMTETTITVIMLEVGYLVLKDCKKLLNKNTLLQCMFGALCCGGLIVYCNNVFYQKNPDYVLHPRANFCISIQVLKENIKHLSVLLRSFSVININRIPFVFVCIILMMFAFIIYNKLWLDLFLGGCALIGSSLFLALSKTMDYRDSILFSQTRMFLFIPYVLLILIYFIINDYYQTKCKYTFSDEKVTNVYICVLVAMIFLVSIKCLILRNQLQCNDYLYCDPVLNVIKVEDIKQTADIIKKQAEDEQVDLVVFKTDNRCLGYATSALNYNSYIGYNGSYDRRTKTYTWLKDSSFTGRVMMIETDGFSVINTSCFDFENILLIEWLGENYGLYRYP